MAMASIAARIAQRASMRMAEVDIPSTDESSDEEDLHVLRRRAKAISQAAVTNGCLPAGAVRRPQRRAPIQSIAVLQEALDVLHAIKSQPSKTRPPPTKPLQRAVEAEVRTDVPHVADAAAPASVQPANFARREVESTSVTVEALPSATPPSPSKPVRPKKPRVTPGSSLKAPKAPKASKVSKPLVFSMDDELADEATPGTTRDSSLTRGYDTLGVVHCVLDDGSDAETYGAAGRESSISRGYAALGVNPPGRAALKPPSPAGRLPPVRPPSRGALADAKTSSSKASSSMSAMELDLGLRSDVSVRRQSAFGHADPGRERAATPPGRMRPSRSLGALPSTIPSSGGAASVALPALSAANPQKGIAFGTKSFPKMKTGSVGAPAGGGPMIRNAMDWSSAVRGVPRARTAMDWGGQQLVF
mmetsp:Transcript_65862/g.183511  ORF Transcript_65862/g.183511 Transcript_65862/m.183511 type:complete len:418 (+) Transcript_65862:51-1304(+)